MEGKPAWVACRKIERRAKAIRSCADTDMTFRIPMAVECEVDGSLGSFAEGTFPPAFRPSAEGKVWP